MWTSPQRTVEVRTSGSKISKIAFSNCCPCEEQGGGRILSPQLSWDILANVMEFEVAGAIYLWAGGSHPAAWFKNKTSLSFDGSQGTLVIASGIGS